MSGSSEVSLDELEFGGVATIIGLNPLIPFSSVPPTIFLNVFFSFFIVVAVVAAVVLVTSTIVGGVFSSFVLSINVERFTSSASRCG